MNMILTTGPGMDLTTSSIKIQVNRIFNHLIRCKKYPSIINISCFKSKKVTQHWHMRQCVPCFRQELQGTANRMLYKISKPVIKSFVYVCFGPDTTH